MTEIVLLTQWCFLLYFVALNGGYLLLSFIAIGYVSRYMQEHALSTLPEIYSGFDLPISILVPAYNEETTIRASIWSLLELSYAEYEILVINDGSKDRTLDVLIREFALVPFPEAYQVSIATRPVVAIYHSTVYPNLKVIDKENGGKADSLNAGINISRCPLFCCIDADSILQRDSLQRVVQPFLEDPSLVACGGTVRVANGSRVEGGFLVEVGLPRSPLALFQIVEYTRAFLFGRMGWSPLNAMLIISGAFGLFRRQTVISVGGYLSDTIGEDMELIVRLHRRLRLEGKRYRISFVPDPICWTEAPEDLKTLMNQRVRWQRGLSESLSKNRELLFHPKGGAVGWLAFPFFVLFEWLSPLIELTGYLFTIVFFVLGYLPSPIVLAFFIASLGFGWLLSIGALFLEEISFHIYPKPRQVLILFLAALGESFGYRQLNSVWRLIGLYRWARGGAAHWGEMTRSGSWQRR